jgi:hypothetical protein
MAAGAEKGKAAGGGGRDCAGYGLGNARIGL